MMTMGAFHSQRGSSLLVATLAMLALVAASTGAMVAVVVAHSQRVSHQAQGVQALYLAEMGVEEMLARRAAGVETTSIGRAIPASADRDRIGEGSGEAAPAARLVDEPEPVAATGSYEAKAETVGGAVEIRSKGIVPTPAGRSVTREVRVMCRVEEGRWVPERWEQVP